MSRPPKNLIGEWDNPWNVELGYSGVLFKIRILQINLNGNKSRDSWTRLFAGRSDRTFRVARFPSSLPILVNNCLQQKSEINFSMSMSRVACRHNHSLKIVPYFHFRRRAGPRGEQGPLSHQLNGSQLFQPCQPSALSWFEQLVLIGGNLRTAGYSLFFDPLNNPTLGSEVTVDCVTYLLFKLVYFLLSTLSVSAGCSILSLVTILFTLIELILLFCGLPFLGLSSTNWPSADDAINKKENKQKSPPLHRELINMVHSESLFDYCPQFLFVVFCCLRNFLRARISFFFYANFSQCGPLNVTLPRCLPFITRKTLSRAINCYTHTTHIKTHGLWFLFRSLFFIFYSVSTLTAECELIHLSRDPLHSLSASVTHGKHAVLRDSLNPSVSSQLFAN